MLFESAHIASLALDIIEDHFGDVVQVPAVAIADDGAIKYYTCIIKYYTCIICGHSSVEAVAPLLTSASRPVAD
jgi:hypothetical protein